MSSLSFNKALQLTKSICDPLFATNDKNNTVIKYQTFENIDEDIPGLSQVDRKHLIQARQDVSRLEAEVKYLKTLLEQKTKIIDAQASSLKTIQDEQKTVLETPHKFIQHRTEL